MRGEVSAQENSEAKIMLFRRVSSYLILFKALCSVFRGQLLCFRKKLFQNGPILWGKNYKSIISTGIMEWVHIY